MPLRYVAIPTPSARALQAGGVDAYGQVPEIVVSDGKGNPCRHCLRHIPAGAKMLVLAYRPFLRAQPYAEIGPVFLCAGACERHSESNGMPEILTESARLLVRAYDGDDRIVYGSGRIVESPDLPVVATGLLNEPRNSYLHVRSAAYNCYQCRVER